MQNIDAKRVIRFMFTFKLFDASQPQNSQKLEVVYPFSPGRRTITFSNARNKKKRLKCIEYIVRLSAVEARVRFRVIKILDWLPVSRHGTQMNKFNTF
ncbi:hypothetical protein B7P33_03435 [Sediminicola luteus]|uniref:Uncharacterized protein n=1 Tax=Sediminicola luteus TaxID=319238 RepID=A0A2A4GD33_9FLAO|nr:hypothetical protein B7P33_03435 [Sediminicola luteus]